MRATNASTRSPFPGHRSTLERVPDLDGVLVDDGGDERVLAATLRERGYDASS